MNYQKYEKILMNKDHLTKEEFNRIWENDRVFFKKLVRDLDNHHNKNIFFVGHSVIREVPFHSHDFYEIIYILNGRLENCTRNSTFYMSTGDICIMNLSSKHSLKVVDQDTVIFNICIRADEFQNGTFKNFYHSDNFISRFLRDIEDLEYLCFPNNSSLYLAGLIQTILKTCSCEGPGIHFHLAGQVLQLLGELLELSSRGYVGINNKVIDFLDYIEKNYATVTLASMAEAFNYNESYLSKLIKKHTGQQLSKIISGKKMENAILMLQNTELTINEIAEKVGYSSYSHFYKNFKSCYQETPNEYRERLRQNFDN